MASYAKFAHCPGNFVSEGYVPEVYSRDRMYAKTLSLTQSAAKHWPVASCCRSSFRALRTTSRSDLSGLVIHLGKAGKFELC